MRVWKARAWSELKKKQYLDMHQWMPGDALLLKADKDDHGPFPGMLRVPLLDKGALRWPSRCLDQIPDHR